VKVSFARNALTCRRLAPRSVSEYSTVNR